MEPTPNTLVPANSAELAGDFHPLTQALGASEVMASLAALAQLVEAPRPESIPALRRLMVRYRERLLTPVELPAIRDAYQHASRGEVRELIALDRRLAARYGKSAFADASRHAGRMQLRRLRPLRSTPLQHYLQAVDRGEATGWHVIVFGILLAVFSLPLRDGLVHFATRTQASLVESASTAIAVTRPERDRLREESEAPLPAAIQQVLPRFAPLEAI